MEIRVDETVYNTADETEPCRGNIGELKRVPGLSVVGVDRILSGNLQVCIRTAVSRI